MKIEMRSHIYKLLSVNRGISHDLQEKDRLDSYADDFEEGFEESEV